MNADQRQAIRYEIAAYEKEIAWQKARGFYEKAITFDKETRDKNIAHYQAKIGRLKEGL